MKPYRFVGVLLVLLSAHAYADKPTSHGVVPNDFAYGMTLQTDRTHSVFAFQIPGAVYRSCTRADLGDLRVFNADGQPVPYAIQPYRPVTAVTPTGTKLPLSPIYIKPGRAAEDVRMYVHRSPAGISIRVYGKNGLATANAEPAFYVVASGQMTHSISALQLAWQRAGRSFIRAVRVDKSDDLRHWKTVVNDASIAEMVYGSAIVKHGRIALPAVQAKYLRIQFVGDGHGPRLTSVYAEPEPATAPAPVRWIELDARPGPKPGEFLFDTGGVFPLDRVQVQFPQQDSLMRVRLSACAGSKGPCHEIGSGLIWRLRQGSRVLDRRELTVPTQTVRWLLLQVDQSESSLGGLAPKLNVGWIPDSVVFIARGPAPFLLAYGSRTVGPATYPLERLLSRAGNGYAVIPFPAALGSLRTLGGAQRLVAKRVLPWKQWILWGVLVLSVALLAWMASRLIKQMR